MGCAVRAWSILRKIDMMLAKNKEFNQKIDTGILALAVALTHLRASVFWPRFADTSSFFSAGWIEVFLWGSVGVFILFTLKRHGILGDFSKLWRKEIALLLFLLFSFLSLFWSVSFINSLYRLSIFFFSSLAGAYIGFRYGLRGLLRILFWTGAIIIMLSFAMAIFVPSVGVHQGHPYYGALNGIYWNRNMLGAIVALFNAVFLMRFFSGYFYKSDLLILDVLFYALSLWLVYLAESVAGYLLVLLLNSLIITILVWLRIRYRLSIKHYYMFFVLVLLAAGIVFTNLTFFLGFFNRSPSLTGRIPMWGILLKNVASGSPWIGYGFGAIWTLDVFRADIHQAAGWPDPILISDNGFIDILLHVGLFGLVFFLYLWFLAWVRSSRFAFRRPVSLLDFFPLIFMFFTLLANISFSLFLEVESFVWMVLVAILFVFSKEQLETE
jgi:exopolysaccharide production protein ExoQ